MSDPYTDEHHATRPAVASFRGDPLFIKRPRVQVRIGKAVCCATVLSGWHTADGLEMWQLDMHGPFHGRISTPSRNVRACQGVDGRCTCVPLDFVPGAAEGTPLAGSGCGPLAAPSVAPDGNHGESYPECTE